MFYAVTVGSAPGIYNTEAAAAAAKGDLSVPLSVSFAARRDAEQFLQTFDGAAAVVYTDGACTGNGSSSAAAGVGVFWGHGDARNVSRPVRGAPTNNVAELEAIEDAVDAIGADESLRSLPTVIVTDSKYSIDCLTTWYDGFERRRWMTTGGGPVKNQDLIRRIKAKLTEHVRFAHVRGHRDHVGNILADELAGTAIEKRVVSEGAAVAAAPKRARTCKK